MKKERIDYLVEYLNYCNHQYYVFNEPVITDYEFDMFLKELESLEKETMYILPYSPTQRVGSDLQETFNEVPRTRMMGSIENCYEKEELKKWLNKFNESKHSFILEPKYDGTSCSIIYEDGIIKLATTRGSGLKGTDITANVKTIKNVPLRLVVCDTPITEDYGEIYVPNHIEIRGEILLPKSELVRINKERECQGLEPFANERNCAAGSIKQLDTKVTASRNLIFKPYAVYSNDEEFTICYLNKQSNMLDCTEVFGFDPSTYWLCDNTEQVFELMDYFEHYFIDSQEYKMDGCVIKLNSYEDQLELGYTQKIPKWAKAFKFKQERASTILKSVDVQMGMSGQLSFVANLEPVEVDGSIISRATLNNPDFIEEKDLKLNQYVFVEKGGAVIPNIIGVDYEQTVLLKCETVDITIPTHCPFCGGELKKVGESGANLYCKNDDCEERNIQRLIYFVRKDCMNIEYVAEATIRDLYAIGLVKKWQDLYSLTFDVLVANGFGKVISQKIINQIEKSRIEVEGDKTLNSMGIRMIGKVTSNNIMKYFGSIERLNEATLDDIKCVEGLGDVASESLFEYLNTHKSEIYDIIHILPQELKTDITEPICDKLKGKIMMATGTLSNFTRDGIQKSIKENGGIYASGISKKVHYLIIGDNAGESKIEKAKKNNVEMITESDYLRMIN